MLLTGIGKMGLLAISAIICAIAVGGISAKTMLRSIFRILPLLIMITLIQILFANKSGGQHQILGIAISKPGLYQGLLLSLRLLVILFSAKILARMNYQEFDQAFHKLRLPEEITFMVYYAVHIVPAVGARIKHLRMLLILRGIELRKLSLRQKIDIYALTALSVLGGFLSKSGAQAIALELRGFRSKGKSSRLRSLAIGFQDLLILLCLASASMILIIS